MVRHYGQASFGLSPLSPFMGILSHGRFCRLNFEGDNVLVAPMLWSSPLSCPRHNPTADHARL